MEKWIDDLENQLWEADERVKKVTNERDNLFSITMAEKRSTILRSTLHDDLLLFAINIDDMSAIRFRIYLPALSPDPLAEGVLNATSSKMVLEKIEVEDRFAFSLGSRLVKQIIEFAKSSGAEKVLGRFQSRLIKRNNLLAIFRMNEFNISVEGKAIQVSRSIKK